MATFKTAPTPYVCDLPGWGEDGSAAAATLAAEAAADGRTTDADALARAIAWGTSVRVAAPETPGRVRPDISFVRKVFASGKITMPDGRELRHWGFEDDADDDSGGESLPSPLIRVREGQVVHVTLETRVGPHTIHLHGIEPDDHNDGVGHTSFETEDRYTYQFKASQAGTYFYHCHVNTVLHFAMGLFGGLIVDPPEGPGRAWSGGPAYDHERFWVGHAIDPRFEELSHAAGMDGEDVGLNVFKPEYFLLNGIAGERARTDEKNAVQMGTGETLLARLLNANYHQHRWSFGGLDAEFIASDGRPFSHSYTDGEIWMSPAERYDALLKPTRPGVYTVRCETVHWITGKVLGSVETTVTVTGDPIEVEAPRDEPQPPATPEPVGGQTPPVQTPAPAPAPAATPQSGVAGKKVAAPKRRPVKKKAVKRKTTAKKKAPTRKPVAKAKPKRKPSLFSRLRSQRAVKRS